MEGRDAVASLCGLVLRRLQDDVGVTGVGDEDHTPVTVSDLRKIFGEALEQFSKPEQSDTLRKNEEDGS